MENSIVEDFQNLQMFAAYDSPKMDELVQDLTNALEESAQARSRSEDHLAQKKVKRKCKKRKSPANVAAMTRDLANMSEASESSLDEALKDYMENIAQQSDSDDLLRSARRLPSLAVFTHPSLSLAESDSVNENFSPLRPLRRRRRYKRMAVDLQLDCPVSLSPGSIVDREPLRHKTQDQQLSLSMLPGPIHMANVGVHCVQEIVPGKRKRSMKDRGGGSSFEYLDGVNEDAVLIHGAVGENGKMECCLVMESSSSVSSSESDSFTTNDEARDGDDEQSDFFHEAGPSSGIPGMVPWWEGSLHGDEQELDPDFEKILQGSFEHMSPTSQRNFKARLQLLTKPGNRREIREGRRRLAGKNPAYSLSRFMQERHQWVKKSSSWPNSMCSNGVSTANGRAVDATSKRRRKTPPTTPTDELCGEVVGSSALPIPDSNVGNRLLQSMGWTPGTGLGADGGGITAPIMALRRPRRQGLGSGSQSNNGSQSAGPSQQLNNT